jgi:hypothetical protein
MQTGLKLRLQQSKRKFNPIFLAHDSDRNMMRFDGIMFSFTMEKVVEQKFNSLETFSALKKYYRTTDK